MWPPNSACAACKHQRRRCKPDCIFAPYFPGDQLERFQCVYNVFGAKNFIDLVNKADESRRQAAANSLVYEAMVRLRDPVNGCKPIIEDLQHQLRDLMDELRHVMHELTIRRGAEAFMQQPPQNVEHLMANLSTSQQYEAAFPVMVAPQIPIPNAPLMIQERQVTGALAGAGAGAVVQQHHNVITTQHLIETQVAGSEQQQCRHQQLQLELRLSDNRFDGAPTGQNQIEFGSGSGSGLELGSSSVSPHLALDNYSGGCQNELQKNENHPNYQQIVTVPQPPLSLRQHQFLVQEHQEQDQNLAVQTGEHMDNSGGGVGFDINDDHQPY